MPTTPSEDHPNVRWQDSRFLMVLLLPVLAAWAMAAAPESAGGYGLLFWLGVIVLDVIWPDHWQSQPARSDSPYFRGLLRVGAVLLLGLQFFALFLACQGSWLTALSLALCTGLISGTVGHAAAHALGHSPLGSDKNLAWTLMSTMGYPHFMVEHYRGHHPRAATWEDPTSAHEGESFWRFLPRSVVGEVESARVLESHRLAQRHLTWRQSPLARALGAILLVTTGLLLSLNWTGLFFCLVHCLIAICLLEAVNYIEHYGLYRNSLHGFHLRFMTAHAWNSCAPISATLLFDRPIHSDHHIDPWKPFGMSDPAHGPQLSAGYVACILLAMFPYVWCSTMHRRLIELQRQTQAVESELSSAEGPG
ncbi:MAG: fatty acid desaturase [Betaproteobacteria bacterium]|nr:fatty acid desaturase [Betaproteobacteria bacterium]